MAWRDEYFPPSAPLPARSGIKARNRRGDFASNWWGRRWLQTLESFNLASRLARGRSYARQGQVLRLEIAAGTVSALVQGSRPQPYAVSIKLAPTTDSQWRKARYVIAGNLAIAAKLMAGQMPPEVEQCFADAGVPLFPLPRDLRTACSCPDASNPCKHIAAVYYLLAEELDRDPFLLLRLRGITRQAFVALLDRTQAGPSRGLLHAGSEAKPARTEPLAAGARQFWQGCSFSGGTYGSVEVLAEAPLVKALGSLPFWQGEADFLDTVSRLSLGAARAALEIFIALDPSAGSPETPPA